MDTPPYVHVVVYWVDVYHVLDVLSGWLLCSGCNYQCWWSQWNRYWAILKKWLVCLDNNKCVCVCVCVCASVRPCVRTCEYMCNTCTVFLNAKVCLYTVDGLVNSSDIYKQYLFYTVGLTSMQGLEPSTKRKVCVMCTANNKIIPIGQSLKYNGHFGTKNFQL